MFKQAKNQAAKPQAKKGKTSRSRKGKGPGRTVATAIVADQVRKAVTETNQKLMKKFGNKKVHLTKQGRGRAAGGADTAISAEIKKLMLGQLMPASVQSYRLCTPDSSCATTTCNPHLLASCINSSGFVGTYAAAGQQLYYLFRQPLRSAVVLTRTSADFTYTGYFSGGTTGYTLPAGAQESPLPVAYFDCTAANAPHGPSRNGHSYLYLGATQQEADNFVWMATNDVLTLTAPGGGYLTAYSYSNYPSVEVELALLARTQVSTTAAYPATAPGYYCFRYTGDALAGQPLRSRSR